MNRWTRIARGLLPFAVSGGALAFLLTRIDARAVLDHVSSGVATTFVPVLIAFGLISMYVEGVTLQRLVQSGDHPVSSWTFARIKAATYPLGLLHYALGATSLTILLRRRARIGVADAAGVVLLISLFDLGILLLLAAAGVVLFSGAAPAIRTSVVVVATVALLGGFALLRLPVPLGPLERIRGSRVLRSARTMPFGLLLEVSLWRLLFVLTFVALIWAALAAFDVSVPVPDLVINVVGLTLFSALPIAVAGLGTGQLAFVYLFRSWGTPENLLACSLALSAGLIAMRAGMGLLFAGEFTREALDAARSAVG